MVVSQLSVPGDSMIRISEKSACVRKMPLFWGVKEEKVSAHQSDSLYIGHSITSLDSLFDGSSSGFVRDLCVNRKIVSTDFA